MKIRMSSVDVAAEVACLKKKLLGMRMANMCVKAFSAP
jgi:hypothetical protein